MKPVAYPKHTRAPSFTHESSLCSSSSPTDLYSHQKLDNIERYLNKFDERATRLELSTHNPQENRSFTSHNKRTMETSYSDYDPKIRIEDGGYRNNNKIENPRRANVFDDLSHDLPRKTALRDLLSSENKQEDVGKVHDRVLGIEKRVDSMDKKLEQLTSTLESFMKRIEGRLAIPERPSFPETQSLQEPSYKIERQSTLERQSLLEREPIQERHSRADYRPAPERQAPRQEQRYGEGETITEIKLLGNKRLDVPTRIEDEVPPRRAVSRDNAGSIRDRARELLERDDRDRERVRAEERQVETRKERSPYEARRPLERDDRDRERMRGQERDLEARKERDPLEARAPYKELKSRLKSPDSERKRKSVSWSELGSIEGVEREGMEKRQKYEANYDDLESSKYSVDESFKRGDMEKERPVRSRLDDSSKLKEIVGQRRSSITREDGKTQLYDKLHEKYGRYTGDMSESVMSKGEDRFGERSIMSEKDGGFTGEKEKVMEEKRRKIDDEIERRISKQIEMKKKADAAIDGQKKVYEKTSQVEDDFKISPYSTEKSRDKEVVSRLVKEKQMRSDLISKYSETANDPSNRSKSPFRK